MRIKFLKTSPDRAGRYFLQLEDESTMRLYRQTVEDFGLYTGMELTESDLKRLRNAAEEMSAKMRAVRIVSASNVSRRDLEERLIRKGENPAKAKQAVTWLEDMHLIDDRNAAEQVVHSCISRGYGLSRAKQALYEKRIPKELWEEALADYPDQMDAIMKFLHSRLDGDADEKAIKKVVDALMRKGHSYRTIREGLNQLAIDVEDILEEE